MRPKMIIFFFLATTVCCFSIGYGAEPSIDELLDEILRLLDDMLMMVRG